MIIGIAKIQVSKIFKGGTVSALFFTNDKWRTAFFITGGVNSVFRHQKQRHGAIHHILQMTNTFRNRFFAADQRCCQLCGIDLSGAHFLEMRPSVSINILQELVHVVNLSNGCNRKASKM